MINILIFPSGSLVAREIHESLKYEKNICLYGTDDQESNPSSFYFETYIPNCPFITEEEKEAIKKEKRDKYNEERRLKRLQDKEQNATII